MENVGIPYLSARNFACVVLPLPGGPTRRMILGGVDCASAMLRAIAAPKIAAVTERVMMFRSDRCAPWNARLRTFRCPDSGRSAVNTAAEPHAMKLAGPLAARSPGLRLVLALEIECHRSADEILQGRLIDLVAFVDVDGAPDIPVEAGVE